MLAIQTVLFEKMQRKDLERIRRTRAVAILPAADTQDGHLKADPRIASTSLPYLALMSPGDAVCWTET